LILLVLSVTMQPHNRIFTIFNKYLMTFSDKPQLFTQEGKNYGFSILFLKRLGHEFDNPRFIHLTINPLSSDERLSQLKLYLEGFFASIHDFKKERTTGLSFFQRSNKKKVKLLGI
jgi:hypothetical protein